MRRYKYDNQPLLCAFVEDPKGEWVKWKDVKCAITKIVELNLNQEGK